MHIYLWSAAWRLYRVVLNMEASVQAAGGVPRGDLALLNAVVVEVVVIVAAAIAHPQYLRCPLRKPAHKPLSETKSRRAGIPALR